MPNRKTAQSHTGKGRPPAFKTKEEMDEKIEAYFKACEGRPLLDQDGNVIMKAGKPVITDKKPPTVTGLALALGFNSRQSLLNYQAKKEFMDTIIRAKSRVEEYAEQRLYDRDGVQGAKFSLSNNFKEWREHPNFQEGTELEDDPLTKSIYEGKKR